MGLEMKPSKTRITHTLEAIDGPAGFDFLGFHFRQYLRGKNTSVHNAQGRPVGFNASVRPSQESQSRFLRKIREVVRSKRAIHQAGLISLLNPIIRGWGNYFSQVVSKDIFRKMDMHIYQKLWSWAVYRHTNKGHKWIAHKYWILGERGWTFGIDGKITLHKLSDIPIRRHIAVGEHRSPYDGDALYWSIRCGAHPELPRGLAWLLKMQKGYCRQCGLFFKPGDQLARRFEGRANGQSGKAVLVHEHCLESPEAQCAMTMHHFTEEPDEGKLSRPVLKTSVNGDVHA